jgi:hypothetical protein
MNRYVEITFDCLPLRSVGRLDIPIDASPKYRERCEQVLKAISTHGSHNTYFLYNASCAFHVTNRADFGMLQFRFQGTAVTDESDQRTERCYLEVELVKETCDWLTEPIVQWFKDTVPHSVAVEFDRYIAAGDLQQTLERIERGRRESEGRGGFVGMYL